MSALIANFTLHRWLTYIYKVLYLNASFNFTLYIYIFPLTYIYKVLYLNASFNTQLYFAHVVDIYL